MEAGLFYLFETLGAMPESEFYQQVLDETIYGEELGFSAVCPAEHHFSQHYGIMPRVELFLAWVAGRTSRMKLWPMVILAPLRNPIQLAEDLAVIDNFSEGRMVASFGSGYRKYEFEPFGIDMADKADRMNEVIDKTVALWKGESLGKATVLPKPYQQPHPPVYVTTSRPDQIKWAADRGYNIFPAAGFNPAALGRDYQTYKEHAGQEQQTRPFFKWIYVHEDHKTAVEQGQAFILRTMMAFAQGGQQLFNHLIGRAVDSWDDSVERPEWLTPQSEALMNAGVTYEEMVKSGWLPFVCGDPSHVTEILQAQKAAGGNMFVGGFKCGPMPQDEVKRSMRLFAEKVLPNL